MVRWTLVRGLSSVNASLDGAGLRAYKPGRDA